MFFLKNILFWLILFTILYLEPVSIGTVKFSHAWKIIAMFFCILSILLVKIKNRSRQFIPEMYTSETLNAGYVLLVWVFFAGMTHEGFMSSIIITFQKLLPMMFLHYFLLRRYTSDEIVQSISALILFVVLSTVPFYLQLLEPLGQAYDVVSLLGAEQNGFVGIFQNQHAAALTFSLCAVIATIAFTNEVNLFRRVFTGSLAIYLLITSIVTYARSGVVSYVIGVMVFLVVSGKIRSFMRLAILVSVGVAIFLLSFTELNVLKERILGRTIYSDSSALSIDAVSSGRLLFWKTALDIFIEQEPHVWVVGIGEVQLKKEMGSHVGMQIFAHNGFINELLNNGVIGLILLIRLFRCVYNDFCRFPDNNVKFTAISVLGSWVAFIFFQGGEFPLQFLIIILFVYLSSITVAKQFFISDVANNIKEA